MSTEARGQLLGYSLQFPRALLRLLEIEPGGAVGIEIDGDVSAFSQDGSMLTEEDKSSICGNALADKSVNLWKTFYNWCNLIQAREDIDLKKTRFVLYTNHSVAEDSIVKRMSDAETNDTINDIISNIDKIFSEISKTHHVYSYLNFLLNDGLDFFRGVIPRFELVMHTDTTELYDEIDKAIKAKIVKDEDVEYIREHLGGWLQDQINIKISKKELPIITFNEFRHKFIGLFQAMRSKHLVDFSIQKIPKGEVLQKEAKARPVYIQQLEAINSDPSELIEAVSDFLRAKVNRQEWIERDYVDEDAMKDFQARLQSFYATQRKQVSLTYSERSPEEQGQILLGYCKMRDESLNEMTPPDKTISGTYHFLSNQKIVGWHPQWENIFKDEG